jgi:hypothetical protein
MTMTQQIGEVSPLEVSVDSGGEGTAGAARPDVGAARAAPARPSFTITEAGTACSVSRKTITRKLPELSGHGAAKDEDGVWRIPVEALLAVGLHPGRSLPRPVASPSPRVPGTEPRHVAQPAAPDTVTVSRDRWDDLRIRLARAEAEASERALALADARLALRALTAGPAAAPNSGPGAAAGVAAVRTPGGPLRPAPAEPEVVPAHAAAHAPSEPAPPHLLTTAPANDPAPAAAGSEGPVPVEGERPSDDVVAARNLAARTGGYVPAPQAPAKRKRWWRSAS